ncbi:hypothetical protein E4U41_002146 [Claviceps citrina]|nr:hypothetical protein E4U41_002146 [Claviceps citrina]
MKRSFDDVESQGHDGTWQSTASHRGSFDPKRQKQHRTSNHKAKEDGTSFAKKRIRNIARLLQRNKDLPANVQNDLQRELAARKAAVADKEFHKKRSAMISKYHMVRFFERKKASRLVKQLRRKIEQSANSDDVEHLKRQLHIAEVDEAYTIHHPHLEPYRSLYGSGKTDSKDKQDGDEVEEEVENQTPAAKVALDSERPPMWAVVEKAMEQGIEALQQLRERRPADFSASTSKTSRAPKNALGGTRPDDSRQAQPARPGAAKDTAGAKKEAKQPSEKTQLNRRERRRLMREAAAEENSDEEQEGGGFFEGL